MCELRGDPPNIFSCLYYTSLKEKEVRQIIFFVLICTISCQINI